MLRPVAAAALLLVLAFPASASLIEDALSPIGDVVEPATGVSATYQEDAGVHGDAPDTCGEATAERTVDLDSVRTQGMLMDVDDESDAYVFELGQEVVGERVRLDLLAGLTVDRHDVLFDVQAPGCDGSVFDPESSYYDADARTPYEAGPGEAAFDGHVNSGYTCDPLGWKFVANQMGGIAAPATIYVEWTNGDNEYVPVDKATPATVAHYTTPSNLGFTVARMVIVLPADWSGRFHIGSGPCDAVVGTPLPPVPPTTGSKVGEFTVQEAGTHIVVVYIERGTVDKTVDTVTDLAGGPPTSVPASCHTDICSTAFQFTNYDLGASAL